MDKLIGRFIGTIIITIGAIFVFITLYNKQFDQASIVFFSAFAAYYTHHQYMMTREQVRLSLFEKRWEIYQKIQDFCSYIIQHGKIDRQNTAGLESFMKNVYESFRGKGYHESLFLFGDDLKPLLDNLNHIFAFYTSYRPHEKAYDSSSDSQYQKDEKEHTENFEYLSKITTNGPIDFKSYLYFGDYRYENHYTSEENQSKKCCFCIFKK